MIFIVQIIMDSLSDEFFSVGRFENSELVDGLVDFESDWLSE